MREFSRMYKLSDWSVNYVQSFRGVVIYHKKRKEPVDYKFPYFWSEQNLICLKNTYKKNCDFKIFIVNMFGKLTNWLPSLTACMCLYLHQSLVWIRRKCIEMYWTQILSSTWIQTSKLRLSSPIQTRILFESKYVYDNQQKIILSIHDFHSLW